MSGILRSVSAPTSTSSSYCQTGDFSAKELKPENCMSRNLEKAAIVGRAALLSCSNYSVSSRRIIPWLLVCTSIFLAAAFGLLYSAVSSNTMLLRTTLKDRPGGAVDTLVIYTFSNDDPESLRNLQFFVKHGMWEQDGCQYLLIIQNADGLEGTHALPKLPSNARMVRHEGDCFFWGAVKWVREGGLLDVDVFRYIIFLRSTIRGPFLPPYWPASVHWSRIYTSRLTDKVKLVGSTISCAQVFKDGIDWLPRRMLPHVQSEIFATDRVGLQILLDDPGIFQCHDSAVETTWHSEIGASAAILNANYTVDSLMLRYQGVDWQDANNKECNGLADPDADVAYDGIALNPFEVLFVKLQSSMLETQWPAQHMAATYSSWLQRQNGLGTISSNEYTRFKERYRLGRIFTMQLRGNECFDYDFYRRQSPDLNGSSDFDAWHHFLEHGQFEARQFRFTCPDRLGQIGVAAAAVKQMLASPVELQDLPAEEAAELDYDMKEIFAMQHDDSKQLHKHVIRQLGKSREWKELQKQVEGGRMN